MDTRQRFQAMAKKKETPPVEYYEPVTRDYRSVHNAAARGIYFIETEPPAGRPTHGRALHVRKSETIMIAFLARITRDVIVNATMTWRKGMPIPHPDETYPGGSVPLQPLAEGVTPEYPQYLREND
jgi:hypothetical protein